MTCGETSSANIVYIQKGGEKKVFHQRVMRSDGEHTLSSAGTNESILNSYHSIR